MLPIFFFSATATPHIYTYRPTLSLHYALPICRDDNSSNRGLLVMNHENITQDVLHPSGPSPAPRPEAEALKEMEAHGVSVVEVNRDAAGGWTYAQGSALNRRVTPLIEVDINGPAGGSPNMRTRFSPDRSEEHTSELQSLMRISYAVFCLTKKNK